MKQINHILITIIKYILILGLFFIINDNLKSQPCTAINMGFFIPDTIEHNLDSVPSGNIYYWKFNAVAGYTYSFYSCGLIYNSKYTPGANLEEIELIIFDSLWNAVADGWMNYCAFGATVSINIQNSGIYYIWLSHLPDTIYCRDIEQQQTISYISNYFQPPSPSLLTTSSDTINCGNSCTLTATGGTGTTYWYSSSCGSNLIGIGDTLIFSPLSNPGSNIMYYARSNYNGVFSSNCSSISIFINYAPEPTSVNALPPSLLCGNSTDLNGNSIGYSIKWYNCFSGGLSIGTSSSGENFNISPLGKATYYAESFSGGSGYQTFNYSGAIQVFNVPTGITSLSVDASGASGYGFSTPGGLGGRVQTTITIIHGQILSIFVGERGLSCNSGGWNGGGITSCAYPIIFGVGGGATDIRIGGTAINNRVIVAGGGGGGGWDLTGLNINCLRSGGAGGGLKGEDGNYGCDSLFSGGMGGSQTSGGVGGHCLPDTTFQIPGYYAQSGSLGIGGGGGAGGGGGGYYGGGSGCEGGGGGGSSYTDSLITKNTVHTQGFQNGNGYVIISWNAPLCISATRVSVTVTVQAATAPTGLAANPATITCSGSTLLSAISATNIIRWWDATNEGNALGTSQNSNYLTVFPTATTTYYAETFNSCSGNLRASITVTVNLIPSFTQATAIPGTICTGTSSILTAGSTGNFIRWWNSPIGGTMLGTSSNNANFSVYPSSTTTYYAESSTDSINIMAFSYVSSSIIPWVVPSGVNLITIDAKGASGGFTSGSTAGKGARIAGTFSVNQSDTLLLLVGQCPGLYSGTFPGGGGGTYVAHGTNYSNATILIAAGGGGGSGNSSTGVDATITTNGTGLNPGTNGNGAPVSACAGGGGGFYTSGANDVINGFYGGHGFRQGGAGGTATPAYDTTYQSGGFGGGATGDYHGACHSYAGSGGGYSGGSGTTGNIISYGQSGGSYNGGTNQINTAGYNTGNGQVIISWQLPLCVSSRISVTVTVGSIISPVVNALNTKICSGNSWPASFKCFASRQDDYYQPKRR